MAVAQAAVAAPGWAAPAYPVGAVETPYAFTVGRFLGGVFSTWGRIAGWVVAVALVAYAPAAIAIHRMYAHLSNQALAGPTPADPIAFVRSFAAVFILLLLITPLERAAIARAAVRRLREEPVGFGDMVGTAFRYFFPTFALLFLVGLAFVGTACTLFIVGLLLLTAWSAALPAMITEELGPIEALKRSWGLTRGLRWQVFAGFLVVMLVVIAVSCVLQTVLTGVVVGIAASAARENPQQMLGAMSVVQAVNVLLQGIYSSVLTTTCAVAYHQLRTASEGPPEQHLGNVFE